MNRRGFLAGMLAACAAPAVVKAGILMPSRGIIVPQLIPQVILWHKDALTLANSWPMNAIAKEAMRILETTLVLGHSTMEVISVKDTVRIRRPNPFVFQYGKQWEAHA